MSRNLTKYTLTTPNATCNDAAELRMLLAARPQWAQLVATFRARTRAVLFAPSGGVPRAVHSAACYKHCNTESAAFSAGYSVGGVALADALDAFAFGAPPPPLLVENCTGFACGADCRPA